jgi:uncharacterized protein (UPF0332 family)
MNPEHLFEQAETLIQAPAAGRPRQVDLRRGVSAAYYALFHAILATAADLVVGTTNRSTILYELVYRSIDHRALRELCTEVGKTTLTKKYAPYAPSNGFGSNIEAFAAAFVQLQIKRHEADYNPLVRITTSDAARTIQTARAALARFNRASSTRRRAFLTLLMFPPRNP